MPGPHALPPHHTKGSWTPRLAGVAVVVAAAGGVLGIYLSAAHAQHPGSSHHRTAALPGKVVSRHTVGVIDFGPDNDGEPWQRNSADHPLMLRVFSDAIDFVRVPRRYLSAGNPQWAADQMSNGTEIFIYVPAGKCLTQSGANGLTLAHCDLTPAQRWRVLNSRIVLGQAVAQYANASTGACLTAPRRAGQAAELERCGQKTTKTQEIAFWWSA
jgi:hypothetical protein